MIDILQGEKGRRISIAWNKGCLKFKYSFWFELYMQVSAQVYKGQYSNPLFGVTLRVLSRLISGKSHT